MRLGSPIIDAKQCSEIRTAFLGHLVEARKLVQHSHSFFEFDGMSRGELWDGSDEGARRFALHFNGLCLVKSGIHLAMAQLAIEQNNIHSLGVHARVLIECAAELGSVSQLAVEGSPRVLQRVLNAQEFDAQQLLRRITRGQISQEELEASTRKARQGIGLFDDKQPKAITIADRVSVLTEGKYWYDYLSQCFCDPNIEALKRLPGEGGVLPAPQWQFDVAFAVVLNCALLYVGQMVLGYGAVEINLGYGSQRFDDALVFIERTRETAAPVRAWFQAMNRKTNLRGNEVAQDEERAQSH